MAAATTIIAGAALATSVGFGVNKAVQDKKQAERAQAAIEGYQREEFKNVYAGLTLPVEEARLRREEVRETAASSVEALSRAGARGLVGGLPQVQDFSDQALAQIGADFEKSKFNIQRLIAEDEKRIQGETARREEEDLAGYGALYEAGRQGQAQFGQTLARSIGAAGQLVGEVAKPDAPQTEIPVMPDVTKPTFEEQYKDLDVGNLADYNKTQL